MASSDQSPDEGSSCTASAPFKLAPFSSSDPISWFRRAEVNFRLRKTPHTRKADLVLAALPDDIFSKTGEWISQYDEEIPYPDLKEMLLQRFSIPPSMRAQHILQRGKIPLGTQDPSSSYAEFLALAKLPKDGTHEETQIDLLREIWLQTIPTQVKAQIRQASTMPIADLLKEVTQLQHAFLRCQPATVMAASDEVADDDEADPSCVAWQSKRKNPKPPSTGTYCFYHRRFGKNAIKCHYPCSFAKNG